LKVAKLRPQAVLDFLLLDRPLGHMTLPLLRDSVGLDALKVSGNQTLLYSPKHPLVWLRHPMYSLVLQGLRTDLRGTVPTFFKAHQPAMSYKALM
jgi:hypothetical protein